MVTVVAELEILEQTALGRVEEAVAEVVHQSAPAAEGVMLVLDSLQVELVDLLILGLTLHLPGTESQGQPETLEAAVVVEAHLLAHLMMLVLALLVESRAVAVAVELLLVAVLLEAMEALEALGLFEFGGSRDERSIYSIVC